MIKFFTTIIFVMFLFSCAQFEKPKSNFKYIETSWNYSMINKIYSMRIDSNAVAILRIIKSDSLIHTSWFRDTLNEKQINFLNSEVTRLKKIKVDSIISHSHLDGADATIIMETEIAKFSIELCSSEKTNESFNQLLDFIKSFSKDSGFTQTDSVNVFESLNLNTFPPPPKTIKFTPPIIKLN